MSEIRIDPLSGDQTIIAAQRAKRPDDFKNSGELSKKCPFCIGNEFMTPKTIFEIKQGKDWLVRVVDNKYPFVDFKTENFETEEFYENMPAEGVHEVVIDTPNHNEKVKDFSIEHMKKVFWTLQQRMAEIEKKRNIKYIQIFKNDGVKAGASKEHSHWQIVGLPIIPQKQIKRFEQSKRYFEKKGVCVCCDMINYELMENKRIICHSSDFVAIAPYASKYPYEIWIIPLKHYSNITEFDDIMIERLSEIFLKTINALNKIFKDVNFNICFEGGNNLHWYLQIIPRLTGLAGFELGTECSIDIYAPEEAAQKLKEEISN